MKETLRSRRSGDKRHIKRCRYSQLNLQSVLKATTNFQSNIAICFCDFRTEFIDPMKRH